jgi:HPt (histidine-containing phosphotransfer) domain-containing protein
MKMPQDPNILALLPEFIDTWLEDIESQFKDLILSQNADDLYRMAHTIKGSCLQFGLDDIAAYGIELMGYAKNKDFEKAKNMEDKIVTAFKQAKEYIENN